MAAAPCEPRAALAGDATAVARVTSELERLGVTVGKPALGCSAIEAVVEQDREGGIAVAIRAAGRSEGRVVSDPATAATWIDSWVRDDLDGGWFAPPSLTVRDKPSVVAVPVARVGLLDRFTIAGGYEQGWTDDGSSWTGATLGACTRVGPWCFGARVSARFQPTLTVNQATAARQDLEALATASIAYDVGRMVIAPELGIGVGRLTTARVEGCAPPVMNPMNCMDPTDPMCKGPQICNPDASGTGSGVYVGDDLHAATVTPRVAAALRIAVPLFDHVWLDGLASVTYAPFSHRDAFPAGVMIDPNTMPGGPTAFDLPGEPQLGLQLGIGIRVGAP